MKLSLWKVIKNFKWNSLYVKYLLQLLLLSGLPIGVVCGASFYIYSSVVQNEILSVNLSQTTKISDNIDYNVNNIINQVNVTISDIDVILYINKKNNDDYNVTQRLRRFMNTMSSNYKFVESIYIYSEVNDSVLSEQNHGSTADFYDLSWLDEYKTDQIRPYHIKKRTVELKNIEEVSKDVITIYQNIFYYGVRTGCVLINIDTKEFKKFLQIQNNNDQFLIYDDEGEVIYSDWEPNSISSYNYIKDLKFDANKYNILKENKYKFMYIYKKATLTNWTIVSKVNISATRSGDVVVSSILILIIILTIIISLFLAVIVSARVFMPVISIMSVISDSEKEKGLLPYDNEVDYIISSISKTIHDYNEIELELKNRLQVLRDAQMAALQAQITPHFLYNTLANIGYMAMEKMGGPNDISQAIFSLSGLFKLSMQSNDQLIPLTTEIDHAKKYLEIQKLRYGDKFDVKWHMYGDVLKYRSVKLVLQPILENAIYHGMKPKDSKGTIIIEGKIENNKIVLSVHDDGAGMSDKDMQSLNLSDGQGYFESSEHIGIRNVNQRIKILFGNSYGIEIDNKTGTKVIIKMPLMLA